MHRPARACFVDRSGRTHVAACVAGPLVLFAFAGLARGQSASLIELSSLDSATVPTVVGVSADGSTAFGRARLTDGEGGDLGERPVRWNAEGEATLLPTPANDGLQPDGFALASSADGSVVVGWGHSDDTGPLSMVPLRWNSAGTFVRLREYEADTSGKRRAEAKDVSGDGSVACGYARRNDPDTGASRGQDAILWNAEGAAIELASLGQSANASRTADAIVISADGSTVGGFAQKFVAGISRGTRPVLWANSGAVTSLPGIETLDADLWSGRVTALSSDGTVAVGNAEKFQAGSSQGLVAVRWSNGVPQEIGPGPVFAGAPLDTEAPMICSASGNRAVGGVLLGGNQRGFVWTEGEGTVALGTLFSDGSGYLGSAVSDAISGDGYTIVGSSEHEGAREAFVWYRGEIKELHETLTDAGLNPAAQGWESFRDAIACSHDGTVIVGAAVRNGRSVMFRARIPRNAPPTIATPVPVQAECDGAGAVVTLSVTANDIDSDDRLTVRWSVDGDVIETDENLTPGTEATFQHRYADGEHRVDISVEDDSSATATTGTTVTVQDTTAPSVVTAPDVVVPTDPGEAFATAVQLSPPSVVDLCDGDPDLVSDAPEIYPLGTTTVTWTATDDDGNISTATQRVTVEDREKPRIVGGVNVRVPVDRGKTFATVNVPQPTATDNAPEGLKLTSNTKKRYSVGTSNVVWTATDAAGNKATWTCRVTVVNAKPVADAGKDLTVTTRSETGASVKFDGSRSSDPDDHDLTFRWSGPRVRFDRPASAKTSATLPVGTTTVTLTVTDEAGAKKSDTVRVVVRLQNAQARPSGGAANEAFSRAARRSTNVIPAVALDQEAAAAAASSFEAHRLGIALGDHVIPADDEPFDDAVTSYATTRDRQRVAGLAAARRWFAVYLRSGDEAAYAAYVESSRGVAYATDDLSQR